METLHKGWDNGGPTQGTDSRHGPWASCRPRALTRRQRCRMPGAPGQGTRPTEPDSPLETVFDRRFQAHSPPYRRATKSRNHAAGSGAAPACSTAPNRTVNGTPAGTFTRLVSPCFIDASPNGFATNTP